MVWGDSDAAVLEIGKKEGHMSLKRLKVLTWWIGAVFAIEVAHAQAPCKQGYVWREAFPGDYVCVTPQTREQAASDNGQANARRQPGGGPYGPDTCRQGYVWREARAGDHVCVTPSARDQAAADNRQAANRVASAAPGSGKNSGTPPSRTCTVYEHRDYGGAHWTLRNGDVLRMVRAPDVGTSDGIHRFIYQPSWNDKVSSFKVDPGCSLTLWEHVNYGGSRFRANKSYSYVGDGWNDKASDAVCECTGSANW